jgi:hypothetical protein
MSSNNPESQGQDWPIYPGTPGGQAGPGGSGAAQPRPPRRDPEPSGPPYAEPPADDDAYRAYQSYSHRQQPMTHYQHRPQRPNPHHGLHNKYLWIVIGIIAALVITSMARGGFNLWPVLIFGGIAWWIISNKRKR